jgi:hypothetical protein
MGILSEGWNWAVRGGLAIALKAESAKIKPRIHTGRRPPPTHRQPCRPSPAKWLAARATPTDLLEHHAVPQFTHLVVSQPAIQ